MTAALLCKSVARLCRAEEYDCPAELRDARTAARASVWAWGEEGERLVAGVDVDDAGVGLAVVEVADANGDVDAGSDDMVMRSSFSLCSDLIVLKDDGIRCQIDILA
jgi:hypothetical protein